MRSKLQNFVSAFQKHYLDAYLVTKDVNIRYLTDFPASESWLFVSPKKSFYVTDFRYILEARAGLKGVAVRRYQASLTDEVASLAASFRLKRIGFDDCHLSLAVFKKLKKSFHNKMKPVAVNHLVEHLREIKSKYEIHQIRKALKLNLEAYDFLKEVIRPGVSEKDVLRQLEKFVKEQNADFSFDPIIAAGPNSCFPHAKVTDRKIKNNESVLVDMGMDIGGYKSDLTRVFFLGKIPQLIREVCDTVKTAQQKAISKIKANVPARDVDFQARNYLTKKGLGKFFGHSLGHGVGLEIHESPSLSQLSPTVLKEGMVVTVEPAVYLPYQFGIRIEDMVLVTKNGCEVLSRNKKFDQVCP